MSFTNEENLPVIELTDADLNCIREGEVLERPTSDGTTKQLVFCTATNRHQLTGSFIALASEEIASLAPGGDRRGGGVQVLAENSWGDAYYLTVR